MEIITAKSAGFCFGVARAVNRAYKEAENKKIYTYGPLIHNQTVINRLEQHGVFAVNDTSGLNEGDTLLIRSHGVSNTVYEDLNKKKLSIVDCTCPDVKKIHDIVNENLMAGIGVIIVGDRLHPEVAGYAGCAIVLEKEEDIEKIKLDESKTYAVAAQTTFRHEVYSRITDKLVERGIKLKIHDTICRATAERQKEADEISRKVDIMLILGDKKSSNTAKLYEICKKNCEKSYLLESINDLVLNIFSTNVKIGITAGASTPPDIIKEAVNIMNDIEKNTQSFEEMLDESLVTLHTGDVVKGTVINVTNNEISVNLGYKSDGIIQKGEYTDDLNADLTELVKPGEKIEVYVLRVNDKEGNVLLSKKRLDSQKGWAMIEDAFSTKTPIGGKFVDVVKGGMMANISGVRVFVPSSQVSGRYVEDLKSFKGKEFNFTIIEYDRNKRRVVAGRKELAIREEKELKEKVFSSLEVGQRVEGTVSRLVDFGAFVDLGGVDGLIHISQMSWGRVKRAKDVVSEGDKVIVTVLDVNKESSKISLSLKDINNDPWLSVGEKYIVGEVVEGKVVRMAPFGAFIELEEGVDGLVHVSQISDKHVPKPDDALSIGEIIKVKITEVDSENKRISLSKKEADGVAAAEAEQQSTVDAE